MSRSELRLGEAIHQGTWRASRRLGARRTMSLAVSTPEADLRISIEFEATQPVVMSLVVAVRIVECSQ